MIGAEKLKEKQKEYNAKRKAKTKIAYAALMKFYPMNPKSLLDEIWRDIEGYEGMYQISNYGRVKSFRRNEVKILKPYVCGSYLCVDLMNHCKRKMGIIHILVAKAFIPNPENKPTVNHIDGVKFNCYVSNLEWATYSENTKHAYGMGLETQAKGDKDTSTRLKEYQVREILQSCIPGDKEFGIRPLAKKYGVGKSTIRRIINGEVYKNVPRDVDKSGKKS